MMSSVSTAVAEAELLPSENTPNIPTSSKHTWLHSSPPSSESKPSNRPSIGTIQGIRRIASEGHTWAKKFHVTVSGSVMNTSDGERKQSVREEDDTQVAISDGLLEVEPPERAAESGTSMRQAFKDTARTERSVSRGRPLVDKSIEATVKHPEASGNVRSRKASHLMGVFDPQGDTRKGRGQRPRSDASSSASRPDSPTATHPSTAGWTVPASPLHEAFSYFDGKFLSDRPSSSGDQGIDTLFEVQQPSSGLPLRHDHDPYFRSHDSAHHSPVPENLLQEIRETKKENLRHHEQQPRPASRADAEKQIDPQIPAQGVDHIDDDEEHISSAVYYPHPGPTPEEIEQYVSPDEHRELTSTSAADKNLAPDTPGVTSQISALDVGGFAAHIDISVQARNEMSVFHGKYQPEEDEPEGFPTPRVAPVDEKKEPRTSSASESEIESADDLDSQTDDGTKTPRQRSPEKKRDRASTASKTKNAVVLEPYKHQVGGHSTIFRFSRRAVCKQLNNRENEFYERIEQRHPELLKFLPR